MLQTERLSEIKEYLQKKNSATIREFSDLLHVSPVTVRKDLAVLEASGFLTKTHGGAVLYGVSEVSEQGAVRDYLEEMGCVAELAARQIQPGDSIFLGSGMTCMLLAKKIRQIENLSIVTNNVSALQELIPNVKNVMLIGGELTYHDQMIYSSSERVEKYLEGIFISKAFTSAIGLDPTAGLTVNNMSSSYIYKSIPSICQSWYVMCDHSKINKIGLYQVAPMDRVDFLVTDRIDEINRRKLEEQHVALITPEA